MTFITVFTPTLLLVRKDDDYVLMDSNGHSDGILYTFPFKPTPKPVSDHEYERFEFLSEVKREGLSFTESLQAEYDSLKVKFNELLEWDEKVELIGKTLFEVFSGLLYSWQFVESLRSLGWSRERDGDPTFWVADYVGKQIEDHDHWVKESADLSS